MDILAGLTPNIFFTGKGGVGKTSISCAVAVKLADAGKSVLLVSTDPASNLDEIFATRLSSTPTPIVEVPNLSAMNIDPIEAAAAYRERVIGPYRGVLPQSAVDSMEEQLSGACTVEIAAFNEFARLIGEPDAVAGFDHVVFDTAPTGHTLRLLALPSAWTGFIETNTTGTSCLGPLQGMIEQRQLYAAAVAALADAKRTTLVLVSRPDRSALDEAARTSGELSALAVDNQRLVVNGVFTATDAGDPVARAMERRGAEALADMPTELRRLPRADIRLKSGQLIGVDALRGLLGPGDLPTAAATVPSITMRQGIDDIVTALARQSSGLIMTMGKGGVGKTSVATDIALALARRGKKVFLTTTDPAAHAAAVDEAPAGLEIGRIDPVAEVERYRAEVMATTGAKLDAQGQALLAEDLSTPCTEEIAVFQAFARAVDRAADRFVVLDTAPTGHTVLLLDAAQAFHREVSRQAKAVPAPVLKLLTRLRDPAYTSVILCTLAEATPVHEAAALQADLRRAGIEPFAWVITQSLTPVTVKDPVLAARRAQERRYIDEVATTHAALVFLVPWRDRAGEPADLLRSTGTD
jgi:arsenite-transporting ATPase